MKIKNGAPNRRESVYVAQLMEGDASAANQPDELFQVEFEL